MDLNVFRLKEEEGNVAETVKYPSHRVAKVNFVSDDSLEGFK